MARFKLTIEYDGTNFVGWQRQNKGTSVQQSIEEAILKFCGQDVRVHGAGRTDAGVHARGQVAHIDLAQEWAAQRVREAINFHLKPARIAIVEVEAVADAFEARFSATMRHYVYRIIDRRAPLALDGAHAWHVLSRLDEGAMHEGAQYLIGKHDFTTFRASLCQAKSPIRSIETITVTRDGDELQVRVSALSFLHNQVRSIVGSLALVGRGKWAPAEMGAALAACERARCGPVAPALGLYLTQVEYPKIPSQ